MTTPTPHGCCSCPGPQGPQGIQGMQGPQGLQGPKGKDGANGSIGPMGPQGTQGNTGMPGPMGIQGVPGVSGPEGTMGPAGAQGVQGNPGPQGVQGLQGPAGLDCDCDQSRIYCSLFSQTDQTLSGFGSGSDFAKLDIVGVISSPLDFDTSFAATLGQVKFLKAGVYTVAWDANGMLSAPFPSPVPSWALAFYLNGIFVPGSSIASFSQSPDDDANCLTSVQNIKIAAGDVLVLRNVGKVPIFLKSNHPELVVPMTCASFSAIKIG